MPTMLRRTRNALLGLAVLGALGFGTSAALAEPLRVPECEDLTADGSCSSDYGCRRYCERLTGTAAGAFCIEPDYCCYCGLAS